jgi:putative ABC transport system substrate-binding protein
MNKNFLNRVFVSHSDNRQSKTEKRPRRLKWSGFTAFVLAFVLCGAAVQAQQPAKIPRIGFVTPIGDPNTPGFQVEAFRRGLRDFGYIEGKNIVVEYRYTEGKGDRNPSLVAELVQLKVDVLVVPGPGAIRAAKQATKTIPIVIISQ